MDRSRLEQLATMRDTQELLRLSRPSIYRLIESGELEALHFGRALRITMRSIEQTVKRKLEAALSEQGHE